MLSVKERSQPKGVKLKKKIRRKLGSVYSQGRQTKKGVKRVKRKTRVADMVIKRQINACRNS